MIRNQKEVEWEEVRSRAKEESEVEIDGGEKFEKIEVELKAR